nr:ABC transporter permease [Cytophagales bacterium]
MLTNYLKIAVRTALRNKTFSFVNLFGLAIGLAAAMATLLFLRKELSFDTFHRNYQNIYQVCLNATFDGKNYEKWSQAPNKMGPYLKDNLPEVKQATRVLHHNFGDVAFVSHGEKHLTEKKLYFADASILEIFDFRFKVGDPKTALNRPKTAIVRHSTAQKYFGNQSPIGKTLKIDNSFELEITGVFDDFSGDTHLDYDILGSFASVEWASRPDNQSWSNASFETFLLLAPNTDGTKLSAKIEQTIAKASPRKERFYDVYLRPLSDVHLYSADFTNKIAAPYGSFQQTNILIGLAVALLLIAAINYMNLSTARLQRSFREVGISKTLGASFSQMVGRFYSETFLYVTVSLLSSILLIVLLLPFLNQLTEETLRLGFLKEAWFWMILLSVWLVVGLLAGAYPSLLFSRFSPKSILQGNRQSKSGSAAFRKSLVVFQFAASVVLIVTVIVFQLQIKYLRTKNPGFQAEHVVAVMTTNLQKKEQFDALENGARTLASVKQAAFVQSFPGIGTSLRNLSNPKNEKESVGLYTARTRPEIIEAMGLKLLAGKTIPKKQPEDTTVQVVLNKTAVMYLGLTPEQAIGRKVKVFTEYGDEIVGVVDDFHFQSLQDKIVPFAYHNARTESYNYLMVRFQSPDVVENMAALERVYRKVNPGSAFEYVFLNQHLENLYRTEKKTSQVVSIFAFLAIFIACLGLFG